MSTKENFQSFLINCQDRVFQLRGIVNEGYDPCKVFPSPHFPKSEVELARELYLSVLKQMHDEYHILCNWYGEHRNAALVMFMNDNEEKVTLQFCQIDKDDNEEEAKLQFCRTDY